MIAGAWWRSALAASTLALAVAGITVPPASAGPGASPSIGADPGAESLMDLALAASRSQYEGTVSVTVQSQAGRKSGQLHVVHADASHLVIEAPDPPGPVSGSLLVQTGRMRSVALVPDGTLSQGETAGDDIQPDANFQQLLGKYRVVSEGPTRVLQRDAGVVRIDRISDGRAVERWTIELRSGLLLQRESYDAAGAVERSAAFTSVQEPYVPTGDDLHPASQVAPFGAPRRQWFAAAELTRQARTLGAPTTLPAGYRLESGTSFKAGRARVVQFVYSDGLQEVSLFAQPGRLVPASLPATSHRVQLRRVAGQAWDEFPRGVAWQDGRSTITLVGASPSDELTQMADALPQAALRRTVAQRIRNLVDWAADRIP